MHRQVSRAKALFAVAPAGLVVLGADGLNYRDIAPKRPQVRGFGARLSETGGIENDCGLNLIQPVLHHCQATRLLETGHGNRQGIETCGLHALAEHIDKRGIGRLQMRAIEQQRRHRIPGLPVSLPVTELRAGMRRMINRGTGQGLRLVPPIVAAQPLGGQATIELQGIVQPALAQKMPQTLTLAGRHRAQCAELRVGTVIARHQNQGDATFGQLHQALDAVAPVTYAAVQ